jgi:hypothetical protein
LAVASNEWDSAKSDDQALVEAWIANADASPHAHEVDRLARYAPELGWRAILAILELPDSQSHLGALAGPLGLLVSQFGPSFIERIEAEAAINPPLRRCLAKLRSDPIVRIPEELWQRLSEAAGTRVGPIPAHMQELYDDIPGLARALHFDPRPMDPEQPPSLTIDEIRERACAWVVYQQTFWAWEELRRIADEDGPTSTWPLVTEVVQQGSDRAVGRLGAGLLEDILRDHGPTVIDRIESEAADNPRFRYCLSHVWPVEMAAGIWDRVVAARADEPQRG